MLSTSRRRWCSGWQTITRQPCSFATALTRQDARPERARAPRAPGEQQRRRLLDTRAQPGVVGAGPAAALAAGAAGRGRGRHPGRAGRHPGAAAGAGQGARALFAAGVLPGCRRGRHAGDAGRAGGRRGGWGEGARRRIGQGGGRGGDAGRGHRGLRALGGVCGGPAARRRALAADPAHVREQAGATTRGAGKSGKARRKRRRGESASNVQREGERKEGR